MDDTQICKIETDNGDEPMSNHSENAHFSSILERRLSCREVLAGGFGLAVAGVLGLPELVKGMGIEKHPFTPEPAISSRPSAALNPKLNFSAIPITRSDTATIPHGYKAQALIPWGTPITGDYPEFNPDGNTGKSRNSKLARIMTVCIISHSGIIRTITVYYVLTMNT